MRPSVEALTSQFLRLPGMLAPRACSQSFRRSAQSAVLASGTRSSASARHIRGEAFLVGEGRTPEGRIPSVRSAGWRCARALDQIDRRCRHPRTRFGRQARRLVQPLYPFAFGGGKFAVIQPVPVPAGGRAGAIAAGAGHERSPSEGSIQHRDIGHIGRVRARREHCRPSLSAKKRAKRHGFIGLPCPRNPEWMMDNTPLRILLVTDAWEAPV